MEKRQNAQIYVFSHKEVPYGLRNDKLYTPLEVGFECRDTHVEGAIADNSIADNISHFNPIFAELTGQYWVWKKIEEERGVWGDFKGEPWGEPRWVGQTQYRRVLDFPEDFDFNILGRCAITCIHLDFGLTTLRKQFERCHSKKYIDEFETIVKTLYPDYAQSWDKYINWGNKIWYSNGFILREDDYCQYCRWLFNILFKWVDGRTVAEIQDMVRADIEAGITNPGDAGRGYFYQAQICGFISERLFSLWLQHNFENIYEMPYLKKENTVI